MTVNGQTAYVDYRMRDGRMHLIHSEVPYALRGQGIGKVLVEKTFDYIENQNIEAVAVCSFIDAVAKRSSKWQEIIK